jgi:hypothetical protein
LLAWRERDERLQTRPGRRVFLYHDPNPSDE